MEGPTVGQRFACYLTHLLSIVLCLELRLTLFTAKKQGVQESLKDRRQCLAYHVPYVLALKTITSMIRHDWVKCNDDVRQISGVCSSWLRGRDPSMTLEAFQHLWCHNDTLASIHTVQAGTEERLELKVHLSASSPVPLF